jgi:predicted Zn-dependent peptidase
MKNIREEKGLTYGIYSSHDINKLASTWYIETEMNSKSKNIGIGEISKEMNKLRTSLIPIEELNIARNYLFGSILKSLDNTLSLSNRMKMNLDFDLGEEYLSNFLEKIKSETPESLLLTAQKYFTEEGLVEVVVGKN